MNNPLQQATEARRNEVENLKSEIVSLKARIQLLEEGQTKDLTLLVGQKVDEAPSSIEVKQLQEQLHLPSYFVTNCTPAAVKRAFFPC